MEVLGIGDHSRSLVVEGEVMEAAVLLVLVSMSLGLGLRKAVVGSNNSVLPPQVGAWAAASQKGVSWPRMWPPHQKNRRP